jgi:cobyrinic acid ac-diamide synthase
MKIVSIINPKGGAGKTVSSLNIAYALKNRNKKVLLIDTDPRGAIATYLAIENENTILEAIIENYQNFGMLDISKYVKEKNGVDIIVANSNLIEIDEFFRKEGDIQGQLNSFKELSEHFHQYDYVVVDTEGTINNMIRSILNTTDYIFAPTKVSYIDTTGLRDLLKMVNIGKRNNPKISLEEVFCVQVKENTKVFKKAHEELKNELKKICGNCYSDIYIREDANILNSMEENKDIFSYKKSSNAAIDYKNLVDEFLSKREKEEK